MAAEGARMRLRTYLTKRNLITALLVLSAGSCLLLPRGLAWPRNLLGAVLAPLNYGGTYAAMNLSENARLLMTGQVSGERAREILRNNPGLRDQLAGALGEDLRRQVAASEQMIVQQRRRISELAGWRMVMDESGFPCLLVPAAVLAGDLTPYHHLRMVQTDRPVAPDAAVTTVAVATGAETALFPGLAALSRSALVGRVIEAGPWIARLRTVLDAEFRIEAVVARDPNNPREIQVDEFDTEQGRLIRAVRPLRASDRPITVSLEGRGLDTMTTKPVPAHHGILAGDEVFTAPQDSSLPFGLLIGRVVEVLPEPDDSNHVTLVVAPAAELNDLREVYIVLPKAVAAEGD